MTAETAAVQVANLRSMLDLSARRFTAAFGLKYADFASFFRAVPSGEAVLLHALKSVRPWLSERFGRHARFLRRLFRPRRA